MSFDQPGLFSVAPAETPGHDPEKTPGPRRLRGRRRESWRCTVSADVVVTESSALSAAVEQAEKDGVIIALGEDDHPPDASDDYVDVEPSDLDRLAWLLWPTVGLDQVVEADGFDVREVTTEVVAGSSEADGTLTWSVTARLRDVSALRSIAAAAHPDQSSAIDASLAAAWRSAVDVFAPIRAVPGITWQPGPVEIEHVPARVRPA